MVKFPEWNERFFPTLLRCEKSHFWGYFMRPDGVILAVASPDPVVAWAKVYNAGGHRLFTPCLDFINTGPQPARHPHVPQMLSPGESGNGGCFSFRLTDWRRCSQRWPRWPASR